MATGYTPTPDYYRDYIQHGMTQMPEDEYLEHYGVKGMKWRNRKARMKTTANGALIKVRRKLKGMSADEISMNNGKFTFERHDNGKALSTTRPYGNRVYKGKRELYNNGYSNVDAGIAAGRERAKKRKKK